MISGGTMSTAVPIGQEAEARSERRRARRIVILVPVEIQWQMPDGETATREGLARNVDVRGALVQMKLLGHQKTCTDPGRCRCGHLAGRHFPLAGVEIIAKNISSGDSARARVSRT